MRPEIAYPLMPRYEDRIAQRLRAGQAVTIGPAYVTERHYDATAPYTGRAASVVEVAYCTCGGKCPPDYGLSFDGPNGEPVLWVPASRLQPIGGPNG